MLQRSFCREVPEKCFVEQETLPDSPPARG